MTMIAAPDVAGDNNSYAGANRRSSTPSVRADEIFGLSQARSNFTPVTRDAATTTSLVRNSILGLAAVSSIFAGLVSPAQAENAATTSLVRRNEVREAAWWETGPEELGIADGGHESGSPAALAADDLKSWLTMTDSEVSALCGFSRRSLVNWRNGAAAYGASSRRLFSIHALVGHLVAKLGERGALLWFGVDNGAGETRLAALSRGEDGLRRVLTLAEPVLFPEMASQRLDFDSGLDDRAASAFMASAGDRSVDETEPLRRVRKLSN